MLESIEKIANIIFLVVSTLAALKILKNDRSDK